MLGKVVGWLGHVNATGFIYADVISSGLAYSHSTQVNMV